MTTITLPRKELEYVLAQMETVKLPWTLEYVIAIRGLRGALADAIIRDAIDRVRVVQPVADGWKLVPNDLPSFMQWALKNDVDTTYLGAWTQHGTEEHALKQIADAALRAWYVSPTYKEKE